MLNKKEQLDRIESEIKKIENKENKMVFFVPDTKGNPSGSLQYIYRIAYSLKNKGYNVEIAHQDANFVGPGDWLGDEFMEIPHYNIEKENVEISASDILFIPEIYSNVLSQIKELPCKKVIVFQNFEYLTEFMPISASLAQLGIMDAITTSEEQKKVINTFFPYLNVRVLEPGISGMFRPREEPQDLVINIVAKDPTYVNKIIKTFYWKYPIYKWISFRDLRGMKQEEFSKALSSAAITIWVDPTTRFGYSALEALRSKTIVMGKIPENRVDWLLDENSNLNNDILWFDNVLDLPDMIASVVRSWTLDLIPDEIYESMDKYSDMFTVEKFEESLIDLIDKDFNARRIEDYKNAENLISRNNEENE